MYDQTKEQAKNLQEAKSFWLTIKPETVSPQLGVWRKQEYLCKTIACFGGHLTKSPYFQSIGLCASKLGMPVMYEETPKMIWAFEVSHELFGTNLFAPRSDHQSDKLDHTITDHQTVLNRIQWAEDNANKDTNA